MVDFTLVTEKHPAVKLYYDEFKERLAEGVIYKGSLVVEERITVYNAYFVIDKFIPKWILGLAALGMLASIAFHFLGFPFLGWLSFVPSGVVMFCYWFFQSRVFFYTLVRLALKKRGYKGSSVMRA